MQPTKKQICKSGLDQFQGFQDTIVVTKDIVVTVAYYYIDLSTIYVTVDSVLD